MTDVFVVLMTAPDTAQAEQLGRAAVERRLAACASVVPQIHSIYWWEGKVTAEGEALCILKTHRDRVDELLETLRELHPYTVPELLAMPVETGSAAYLDWVRDETRSG